eukprot:scaffold141005_cov35-Tisochrysis_lutea.AAC.2
MGSLLLCLLATVGGLGWVARRRVSHQSTSWRCAQPRCPCLSISKHEKASEFTFFFCFSRLEEHTTHNTNVQIHNT